MHVGPIKRVERRDRLARGRREERRHVEDVVLVLVAARGRGQHDQSAVAGVAAPGGAPRRRSGSQSTDEPLDGLRLLLLGQIHVVEDDQTPAAGAADRQRQGVQEVELGQVGRGGEMQRNAERMNGFSHRKRIPQQRGRERLSGAEPTHQGQHGDGRRIRIRVELFQRQDDLLFGLRLTEQFRIQRRPDRVHPESGASIRIALMIIVIRPKYRRRDQGD